MNVRDDPLHGFHGPEMRAPDPTLSAMEPDTSVWIEDAHPRVAHTGACDDTSPWHEEAQDARWFAVACRTCFPEAPPLGHEIITEPWRFGERVGELRKPPESGLTWQLIGHDP